MQDFVKSDFIKIQRGVKKTIFGKTMKISKIKKSHIIFASILLRLLIACRVSFPLHDMNHKVGLKINGCVPV